LRFTKIASRDRSITTRGCSQRVILPPESELATLTFSDPVIEFSNDP
jgi:hypothetical protein